MLSRRGGGFLGRGFLLAAVAGAVEAVPTPTANGLRGPPSADLPLTDHRLRQTSTVEQVHLTYSSPTAVFVTWVTNVTEKTTIRYAPAAAAADASAWSEQDGAPGQVYSSLMDPRFPASEGGCIGSKNYTNPYCFYTSGEIHNIELTGLTPATVYKYSVGSATAKSFAFKTPPAAGPVGLKLAIVGDTGQTENTSYTLAAMEKLLSAGEIDLVLHAGDLSYSDGNGHRWDSFGRLSQPLFSSVPMVVAGGNHEISNGGENWVGYNHRYPNPHSAVGSDSSLWYSVEAGPAHVIVLCSYADFSKGSIQAQWLRRDLAAVDRAKTPWLIALWHTPWYTSNHHHPMKEGAEMRASMETMLMEAKVDLIFNGHVHAFERTLPVYQEAVDEKQGIPYITIGDGGNREWFALPWNEPQPAWSAIREDAFGFGTLSITAGEKSTATWNWLRNANTRPTSGPFAPTGPDAPTTPGTGALGDTHVFTKK